MEIQMNTTKTLFISVALAAAAPFGFAQEPPAPIAPNAVLAPVAGGVPTHAAAKRTHATKHHAAQRKHATKDTKPSEATAAKHALQPTPMHRHRRVQASQPAKAADPAIQAR